MEALVKRVGKAFSLVGKGNSNHWIPMDGPEKFGGYSAATRPLELILIGLAGCTSMDVISILDKMKVKLDDYELKVEAEQAEDYPKVFRKINLHYRFFGDDIDSAKVEKAIKLSEEKYCAVSAMLRHSAEIDNSYEIIASGSATE